MYHSSLELRLRSDLITSNEMDSPMYTSTTTTETGSPIYTPSSPSQEYRSSTLPAHRSNAYRPDQHVVLYVNDSNFPRRKWVLRLGDLRQYAQFNEHNPRSSGHLRWPIYRYADEFDHIVNYITEGEYPILYTEGAGFDVLKYVRVRRCAKHYGVRGLAEWIDAKRYRDVVVKVSKFGNAMTSAREAPADTTLTLLLGQHADYIVSCRTVWKTELMKEDRGDQNAGREPGDPSGADGLRCENCANARSR